MSDEVFDDADERQQDQPQAEDSQPQPEVIQTSLMEANAVR
jgi:hypothetical protein